MKQIELTQGRVALVDDEDFEWLSKWKWYYLRAPRWRTGYAVRNVYRNRRRTTCRMHISIAQHHKQHIRGCEIDHRNGCGCDNRKENLRKATRRTNGANCKQHIDNTSGITGVSWDASRNKWKAFIGVDGECKTLGRFTRKQDAINCRLRAETTYYGEFQHNPTNVCPLGPTGECPDCAARLGALSSS